MPERSRNYRIFFEGECKMVLIGLVNIGVYGSVPLKFKLKMLIAWYTFKSQLHLYIGKVELDFQTNETIHLIKKTF